MSRKVLIVAFFLSATLNFIQGFSIECQDSGHYAAKCPEWANNGDCTKVPDFMKKFCKKSCNECSTTSTPSENKVWSSVLRPMTPMFRQSWEPIARAVDGFDPHHGGCTNVSTYEPVAWRSKNCTKCTASFPKKSVDKSEKVCIEVPSVDCDIFGYTECSMVMVPKEYNITQMTEKSYQVRKCEPVERTIMHKKKVPECKNVTRHHCVTKWKILPSGERIFSDNDDCREFTWQECSLKEIEVPFVTTEIECKNTTKIPWMDCEEVVSSQMTMNMTCEPKAAVKCVPINETLCITVEWQESYLEVEYDCETVQTAEPYQEVYHRKKCLLSNTDADLDTEDLVPDEKDDGPVREKQTV